MPKFPDVTVTLTGKDGNAFAVMGAVRKAMRQAKISQEEIEAYQNAAMNGDYDNLLRVTMETVNVR